MLLQTLPSVSAMSVSPHKRGIQKSASFQSRGGAPRSAMLLPDALGPLPDRMPSILTSETSVDVYEHTPAPGAKHHSQVDLSKPVRSRVPAVFWAEQYVP